MAIVPTKNVNAVACSMPNPLVASNKFELEIDRNIIQSLKNCPTLFGFSGPSINTNLKNLLLEKMRNKKHEKQKNKI